MYLTECRILKVKLYLLNPYITEVLNLIFKSLEVVSRYRDTQLKVA